MTLWLSILFAGALTYTIRLSFIQLFANREIPAFVLKALRFVPAAVLTAIITPELFIQDGDLSLHLANGRLLAGLLAILVAWRTRNVILTILVGMAALWLLQWLI
ncbi:MAG: branched-chain amino acid ABC transporter permease [Chloroflexi bacterium RBG_16_58_14]|nr:MAG: branched-chain amino acid ABC transporter permease [Chloroflexi bacterium RBG_16_58_14]